MTEAGPKLSTQELESLSEEERNSLLAVLARAKVFETAMSKFFYSLQFDLIQM